MHLDLLLIIPQSGGKRLVGGICRLQTTQNLSAKTQKKNSSGHLNGFPDEMVVVKFEYYYYYYYKNLSAATKKRPIITSYFLNG